MEKGITQCQVYEMAAQNKQKLLKASRIKFGRKNEQLARNLSLVMVNCNYYSRHNFPVHVAFSAQSVKETDPLAFCYTSYNI